MGGGTEKEEEGERERARVREEENGGQRGGGEEGQKSREREGEWGGKGALTLVDGRGTQGAKEPSEVLFQRSWLIPARRPTLTAEGSWNT
jgi:hypothetical protein